MKTSNVLSNLPGAENGGRGLQLMPHQVGLPTQEVALPSPSSPHDR